MEHQEIIFNYYLQGHGWSDVQIISSEKTQNIVLTHIFGCLLTDLLNALIDLMKGEQEVSFYWHDEPSIYKVEFLLDGATSFAPSKYI